MEIFLINKSYFCDKNHQWVSQEIQDIKED